MPAEAAANDLEEPAMAQLFDNRAQRRRRQEGQPPTMGITPTRRPANIGVSVRILPGDVDSGLLRAIHRSPSITG